jgi:hypothetical protein
VAIALSQKAVCIGCRTHYLNGGGWKLVAEYVEMSGKRNRPATLA